MLVICSWQFSASAIARTVTIAPSGGANSPVAASSSTPTGREHAKAFGVDGTDCITPTNQEKQPAPDRDHLPDSTTDIDDSDSGLDDLSADTSIPSHRDAPLFSVTDLEALTLRTVRIVPILLFPVHCFYCLHEHIRERAPPSPAYEYETVVPSRQDFFYHCLFLFTPVAIRLWALAIPYLIFPFAISLNLQAIAPPLDFPRGRFDSDPTISSATRRKPQP